MGLDDRDRVVLEGCNWRPRNVSELGCIEGALKFLGVDVSPAWLCGGIGYAFFPFIPGDCGGDPAFYVHGEYLRRASNVGCRVTAFLSDAEGRKEDVIQAIRDGRPCVFFSWEDGEYVMVKGIGPDGFVASYYGGNEVAKPWKALGDTYSIRAGMAASPTQTIPEAFELAVQFSDMAKTLTDYGYYANWKKQIDAGTCSG